MEKVHGGDRKSISPLPSSQTETAKDKELEELTEAPSASAQSDDEEDGADPHSAPTEPLSMSERVRAVDDEEGA